MGSTYFGRNNFSKYKTRRAMAGIRVLKGSKVASDHWCTPVPQKKRKFQIGKEQLTNQSVKRLPLKPILGPKLNYSKGVQGLYLPYVENRQVQLPFSTFTPSKNFNTSPSKLGHRRQRSSSFLTASMMSLSKNKPFY